MALSSHVTSSVASKEQILLGLHMSFAAVSKRLDPHPSSNEAPAPRVRWRVLLDFPNTLEAGDIVHIQNSSILARMVRWFTRAMGEEKTWASHTAMVIEVASTVLIIEALSPRVKIRPLAVYTRPGARVVISRRPGGLTQREKATVQAKAREYYSRRYGYLKVAAHALDRFINNRYFFRRLARADDYPICSWLVAFVYDRSLGIQFGMPPNAAQPDDIMDYCVRNHWPRVWADSLLTVDQYRTLYDPE